MSESYKYPFINKKEFQSLLFYQGASDNIELDPLEKDLEEFYFTMRTMAPLLPVHVDTAGIFIRENPHIPREAVYHTFLLDKDNRVVLVGNPSRSEKIKEMFWQIVEEKLGKRE